MFSKISVAGDDKHPLYKAADDCAAEGDQRFGSSVSREAEGIWDRDQCRPRGFWNFEKFLVSRNGEVVKRFSPDTLPDAPELVAAIKEELAKEIKCDRLGRSMDTGSRQSRLVGIDLGCEGEEDAEDGSACRAWCARRSAHRCLSRIPFETHRPSPVPASPLVVTKGWNRRSNMYASMPEPLSATVTATPCCPLRIVRWPHFEDEAAFVRQGIEGIGDEVREYLLDLSGLAKDRGRGAIAAFDGDVHARGLRGRESKRPNRSPHRARVNAGAVRWR